MLISSDLFIQDWDLEFELMIVNTEETKIYFFVNEEKVKTFMKWTITHYILCSFQIDKNNLFCEVSNKLLLFYFP